MSIPVNLAKTIGKICLYIIPLIILGGFIFVGVFGCGFSIAEDYSCDTLLPISFVLFFITLFAGALSLVVPKNIWLKKSYWVLILILTLSTAFTFLYRELPVDVRLEFFEGKDADYCSEFSNLDHEKDACLWRLFEAKSHNKKESLEICNFLETTDLKERCKIEHRALVEKEWTACDELTALPAELSWATISYSSSQTYSSPSSSDYDRKKAEVIACYDLTSFAYGGRNSVCELNDDWHVKDMCYYWGNDCGNIQTATLRQYCLDDLNVNP